MRWQELQHGNVFLISRFRYVQQPLFTITISNKRRADPRCFIMMMMIVMMIILLYTTTAAEADERFYKDTDPEFVWDDDTQSNRRKSETPLVILLGHENVVVACWVERKHCHGDGGVSTGKRNGGLFKKKSELETLASLLTS